MSAVEYILYPGCVLGLQLSGQLEAASAAGYQGLSVSMAAFRDYRADGGSAASVLGIAADLAVKLTQLDCLTGWTPFKLPASASQFDRDFFDYSVEECLDVSSALGLRSITAVGPFSPADMTVPAMTECYAALCEKAATHGLRVDLEFLPFWGIPDLATAWEIVRGAGAANGGIMFDTWHFLRGNPDLELLQALPNGVIANVQVADSLSTAMTGNLHADCIFRRCFAGDGDLPLERCMSVLERKGGVRSVGPEVFSFATEALSPAEAAMRGLDSTRRLVEAVGRYDVNAPSTMSVVPLT